MTLSPFYEIHPAPFRADFTLSSFGEEFCAGTNSLFRMLLHYNRWKQEQPDPKNLTCWRG